MPGGARPAPVQARAAREAVVGGEVHHVREDPRQLLGGVGLRVMPPELAAERDHPEEQRVAVKKSWYQDRPQASRVRHVDDLQRVAGLTKLRTRRWNPTRSLSASGCRERIRLSTRSAERHGGTALDQEKLEISSRRWLRAAPPHRRGSSAAAPLPAATQVQHAGAKAVQQLQELPLALRGRQPAEAGLAAARGRHNSRNSDSCRGPSERLKRAEGLPGVLRGGHGCLSGVSWAAGIGVRAGREAVNAREQASSRSGHCSPTQGRGEAFAGCQAGTQHPSRERLAPPPDQVAPLMSEPPRCRASSCARQRVPDGFGHTVRACVHAGERPDRRG